MIKRYLIAFSLVVLPLLTIPGAALAQQQQPVDAFQDVCNANTSSSSVCRDRNLKDQNNNEQNPIFGPQGVLTRIINFLTIIVGIAAVIMIILGGMKFVTSGNNPEEVKNGRERIVYALIALVVALAAQAIVRYVLANVNIGS